MKRSSLSPAYEQPTSSNNNEPITSTSGTSTLSLSDLSLELSRGTLSQAELAKIAQEMLSQLHQTSVPPSSGPTRMSARAAAAISSNSHTKDKGKRTIACIELSSDGEEVESLRKVCFMCSCFMPFYLFSRGRNVRPRFHSVTNQWPDRRHLQLIFKAQI